MVSAAFFLIFAVVSFRLTAGLFGVGAEFSNFSPIAAIILCGAAFLPKRLAIAVPLAAMLVTDIVLNLAYKFSEAGADASYAQLFLSPSVLFKYLAFAAIFAIGLRLRGETARGPYQWKLFGGAIAGSLLFYLLANTGSWLALPGYAKTLGGWWQSQTVGLPGYPPTLLFLRNALVGDLFFTGLFAASFALLAKRESHSLHPSRLAGPHASH